MAYGGILNTGASAGWTKDEVMTSETASLYGLGSDGVPNDALNKLSGAVLFKKAKAGDLQVGSIVQLKVNGTLTDFIVVNQGIPSNSGLYDSSCNGTWLLMKDCYEKRQWNSSNSNSYKASTIHSYLNGTFLSLFDADIQEVIKQVKIPYVNGTGSSAVASGANGLSCKIFLLSGREVGFSTSDDQYFPNDGAKLSYFESGTGSSALNKRIAKLNGAATSWWLRSPYAGGTASTASAWAASPSGKDNYSYCTLSYGIRPALVLPSDYIIETVNITSFSDVQGNPITFGAKIVTGSYVGTGTYGSNNKINVYVGFYPKLFIVYTTQSTSEFWFFRCAAMSETDQSGMYGQVGVGTSYDLDGQHARFVPDNGGGIRWWYQGVGGSDTSYAAGQLNTSDKTYYYVAIG